MILLRLTARVVRRRPNLVLLVPLLIASVALPATADQADNLDVPVIHNPAAPPGGVEVVQLEEMWRAGGEDGDEIFGKIFRADADEQGNVYLVDTQLSEVPVFSPDGERIKTLSREGEGPGETREPVDMLLLPDGSVGILQRFPGKVVRIDRDGTPLGDIFFNVATEGGFTALYTGRCRGDELMFVLQRATREETSSTRTIEVARYDVDGTELAWPHKRMSTPLTCFCIQRVSRRIHRAKNVGGGTEKNKSRICGDFPLKIKGKCATCQL